MKKIAAVLMLLAALLAQASAREITDMAGRKVTIPNDLKKVYAPSPYGAYMMYAIAPDLMSGLVFLPKESDKKFLPKALLNLPVIGGGPGLTANPEMYVKTGTQLLVIWRAEPRPIDERTTATLDKLNIPYVIVDATTLADYPKAIRFLGALTHREAHAEKMAQAAEKILADTQAAVAKVPPNQRPRVYYAEGVDGLSTECNDSIHVQLLTLAGDLDVHRCHTASHMGMEKISLEQVMLYQPDVILAQESMFTAKVYSDPAWAQVKAVREHHVYLIPRLPLNWFDRPPSFMRFAGLEWLTNKLYPRQYPIDIHKETQKFYSTFLGVKLSDQDVAEILGQ
ncbi:MAG: ABC transporter substrate-binding protein [Acidobacteriota bacterium]|nr:ABC transporter substrate-binding protein [Acidobacteriota bacterium]